MAATPDTRREEASVRRGVEREHRVRRGRLERRVLVASVLRVVERELREHPVHRALRVQWVTRRVVVTSVLRGEPWGRQAHRPQPQHRVTTGRSATKRLRTSDTCK